MQRVVFLLLFLNLGCPSVNIIREDPKESTDPGGCSDGVDNDGDELVDCDDGDCAASSDCLNPCPGGDPLLDSDGDGVCDFLDICGDGDDALDQDQDGTPNACDPCPADVLDDSDGDGSCDSADLCPGFDDTLDQDGDNVPDDCDPCPADFPNDSDGDGVCNSIDACPGFDDSIDQDGDGQPDPCDPCPVDFLDDSDGDGSCDSVDLCPGFDDSADINGNGLPDGCELPPPHTLLLADSIDGMIYNIDLNGLVLHQWLSPLPDLRGLAFDSRTRDGFWITAEQDSNATKVDLVSGNTLSTLALNWDPISVGGLDYFEDLNDVNPAGDALAVSILFLANNSTLTPNIQMTFVNGVGGGQVACGSGCQSWGIHLDEVFQWNLAGGYIYRGQGSMVGSTLLATYEPWWDSSFAGYNQIPLTNLSSSQLRGVSVSFDTGEWFVVVQDEGLIYRLDSAGNLLSTIPCPGPMPQDLDFIDI